MRKLLVATLGILLSAGTAFGWDVGFSDVSYYVKVKITDGGKKGSYELAFHLCGIGRDDIESGQCIRLSSCRYPSDSLDTAIAALPETDLKQDLIPLTTSSYQSRFGAKRYLPAFLNIIKSASAGRHCVLVSGVEFTGGSRITVQYEFPAD